MTSKQLDKFKRELQGNNYASFGKDEKIVKAFYVNGKLTITIWEKGKDGQDQKNYIDFNRKSDFIKMDADKSRKLINSLFRFAF
jgi:hypothetical protein